MTYEQLTNIFRAAHLNPWEHDYHWAFFAHPADSAEITAKAYDAIEGLEKFFCFTRGNNAYIIVNKGTVIPEGTIENIQQITDVPTEPPVAEEEPTVIEETPTPE